MVGWGEYTPFKLNFKIDYFVDGLWQNSPRQLIEEFIQT